MKLSTEITGLITKIENNRTDGASQLARQAVAVFKTAAERRHSGSITEFLREQKEIGRRLITARPAMAPILNIVNRMLAALPEKVEGIELAEIRQRVLTQADELISSSLKAVARIARHASQLITPGDRIMTHSYSSTVTAALTEAFFKLNDTRTARKGEIEVIITRSGPGRSGERTARELGGCGIPLTFIDDTAIGLYLAKTDKVIVGADRVCADGSVVNGIGSYPLALASRRADIPFYVLCETLKFDPRLNSHQVDLEEKEPAEVVAAGRLPAGIKVKNPYFDITRPELITGVVTENGLLTAGDVLDYLKSMD